MSFDIDALDFVTVDGLLAYGEALASRPPAEGIEFPDLPVATMNRSQRAQEAMVAIRELVQQAQVGFRDAAAYNNAREALIHQACDGDDIVFFAAWNQLLAQGELSGFIPCADRGHAKAYSSSSRRHRATPAHDAKFGGRPYCARYRG